MSHPTVTDWSSAHLPAPRRSHAGGRSRPGAAATARFQPLTRLLLLSAVLLLGLFAVARPATAQEGVAAPPPVDSLIVEGNSRVSSASILTTSGIAKGQVVNYRDIQRAITALTSTGNFDDVQVQQRGSAEKLVLAFVVKERPILQGWTVTGAVKIDENAVRDRVKILTGRPVDRTAVEKSRLAVDSLYRQRGFYAARVRAIPEPQADGGLRYTFAIDEGARVAIGQVIVEGNDKFSDKTLVARMNSKPEGFWWFRKGEYDETKLQDDIRDRLPRWYAAHGYLDFQVLRDSLVPDTTGQGKATLILTVEEGPQYVVGNFDVSGNRRFSVEEIATLYPFGTALNPLVAEKDRAFDRTMWEDATEKLRNLYSDNGYIASNVEPEEIRRIGADGRPVVDLRWNIREGAPANVNKIEIVGNDVTHERVIREAIVIFPGQVFNRSLLIRSYQNISNLNFFHSPLPPPDVQRAANGVDVDVTFRVDEKRTGNINFGASLGQGTGVGGFLGLEEPNLFGKGKRGRLQWQFGANINDFNLSYTDPAVLDSRVSSTISLFDSRARFVVGDLGRRRLTGGSLQMGFPFLGSRYTRYFLSYRLQRTRYTDGSEDLRLSLRCNGCTQSTVGLSLLRDTRIGLPFATAGTYFNTTLEKTGGPLGGTGNYEKTEFEGRFYAPIGQLGGQGSFAGGVQFTLGLTAKSGFVFGDASNFPLETYSMGGVQFGIPLRGYSEFSITPNGFDPSAGGASAAGINSFGRSYAAFTAEVGARVSQQFYLSSFLDAGNVYRTAQQWDPTRLYRGAGFGVALVSPLGPIGVDLAYGFDKRDAAGNPRPGWQVHFRLGNFF